MLHFIKNLFCPPVCFPCIRGLDRMCFSAHGSHSFWNPHAKEVWKSVGIGKRFTTDFCDWRHLEYIGRKMARRPVMPPEWKFDSKDPWDPDTFMIVPVESSQTILPESAAILGIKTFLKLARLPCKVEEKFNASNISPNGKLPVVKCGNYVVSELDGVIHLTHSKGVSLSEGLTAAEKADLRAYLSLVQNVLGNAMMYFCWLDNDVYTNYTRPRVGSPYNMPLRSVLPWIFRRKAKSQLSALKWSQRQPSEVYREVDTCLYALSERLGEQEYFFGESPTELDALVYGYLFTMITSKLPLPANLQLSDLVKQHRNLMNFIQRMERTANT